MIGWRRLPKDALDQEIAFHIAELTENFIAQGLSPEEAHRRCA